MTNDNGLPEPVEAYIRAINAGDSDGLRSTFAQDAVVNDVGREFRGIAAIEEWAREEIFDVSVSLDVMNVVERHGEIVVTVQIDGTFDRTGLPDPLLMDHGFTVVGRKIASLTCRLPPTQ